MFAKVGSVGECNLVDGVDTPTAGQCCTCQNIYVRNIYPDTYTNPQASREGSYTQYLTTARTARVEVTTPVYVPLAGVGKYIYNNNGRWYIGPSSSGDTAWIKSKDGITDPGQGVCPEAVATTGWQVYDGVTGAWVDAPYLYVGCDPPPSPPPSPPPPPPFPPGNVHIRANGFMEDSAVLDLLVSAHLTCHGSPPPLEFAQTAP